MSTGKLYNSYMGTPNIPKSVERFIYQKYAIYSFSTLLLTVCINSSRNFSHQYIAAARSRDFTNMSLQIYLRKYIEKYIKKRIKLKLMDRLEQEMIG